MQTRVDLLAHDILLLATVDTTKPNRLLVPSVKSIVARLGDTVHNIDHYKCDKV